MWKFERTLPAVLIALVTAVFCNAQQSSSRSTLTAQMQHTIASVKASKTLNERTAAAEHLADLAKRLNANEVTGQTIVDLTGLLDSPDDSVRFWIATALGNLGP